MNRCYFRLDKLVMHKCRNLPEVPFWTPGKNRPPPRAQAENQLSALFPGKRAENSDLSLATEKGQKLPKIRPQERCKKITPAQKIYKTPSIQTLLPPYPPPPTSQNIQHSPHHV